MFKLLIFIQIIFLIRYVKSYLCFGVNATTHPDTVCSGHGNCLNTDSCSCDANYQIDSDCGYFLCHTKYNNDSKVCNGKGECLSYDNCTCANGYTGNECEDFKCAGIEPGNSSVCNKRGDCIDFNTCNCTKNINYTGSDCQHPLCFEYFADDTSNVCSGNGDCIGIDTCKCSFLYTGVDCEKTEIGEFLTDNWKTILVVCICLAVGLVGCFLFLCFLILILDCREDRKHKKKVEEIKAMLEEEGVKVKEDDPKQTLVDTASDSSKPVKEED